MHRGPFVRANSDHLDNMVQYRSLLFASHPDSPVRNLYILARGLADPPGGRQQEFRSNNRHQAGKARVRPRSG